MSEEIEVRRRAEWDEAVVEETFQSGVLIRRRRYRNDILVSDMPFGEHGWPLGVAREWYVTGELKRERTFERATAVTGELRTWHRTGELKERRYREDRRWVGQHEKFYADGSVRMVGQWDLGSRHGKWKWYHPNGKIRLGVPYDHGVADGSIRLWRDDGELVLELDVHRGVPGPGWLDRLKKVDEAEYLDWEPGVVVYDPDRRPVAYVKMTGVPRLLRASPRDFGELQ